MKSDLGVPPLNAERSAGLALWMSLEMRLIELRPVEQSDTPMFDAYKPPVIAAAPMLDGFVLSLNPPPQRDIHPFGEALLGGANHSLQ